MCGVIIHLINRRLVSRSQEAREEEVCMGCVVRRFGVRKDIEEEMGSVNVMPQADDNVPARCFDVIPPILPGVHYAT